MDELTGASHENKSLTAKVAKATAKDAEEAHFLSSSRLLGNLALRPLPPKPSPAPLSRARFQRGLAENLILHVLRQVQARENPARFF